MWLRAVADPRKAVAEDLQKGVLCDALGCVARLADGSEVALSRSPDGLDEDCRSAAVVISRFRPPPGCAEAATVIDEKALARGGALALYRLPTGPPADASRKASFRIEPAYPEPRRPLLPPPPPQGTRPS